MRLLYLAILVSCWLLAIVATLGLQWLRCFGPAWLLDDGMVALFTSYAIVMTGLGVAGFVCAAILSDWRT